MALTLSLFLMLVPRRSRWLWAAVSVLGFIAGSAMWLVPAFDVVTLTTVIMRGNTVLAGIYLIAAVAVVNLPQSIRDHDRLQAFAAAGMALVMFPLDGLEFTNVIKQIAFLKESVWPYVTGFGTLAAALCVALVLVWVGDRIRLDRWIAAWSFLLFAVVVRAISEPFLVPAVESMLARMSHDDIHLLIMLVMTPDHTYLASWAWRIIGLAFLRTTAVLLNVAFFAGLTAYLFTKTVLAPLPSHRGEGAARRRSLWAAERTARRRTAAPAVIACAILMVLAVRGTVFKGKPTPPPRTALAVEQGEAVIEGTALQDNKLHVWTYDNDGESVRVLAIAKPDGHPAVCLDACLVCAPDGYAQLGSDLFCLFCGTPIPIASVGDPGGCNPVPVEFEERDGALVFDADKVASQWEEVTGGR